MSFFLKWRIVQGFRCSVSDPNSYVQKWADVGCPLPEPSRPSPYGLPTASVEKTPPVIEIIARRAYCVGTSLISLFVRRRPSSRPVTLSSGPGFCKRCMPGARFASKTGSVCDILRNLTLWKTIRMSHLTISWPLPSLSGRNSSWLRTSLNVRCFHRDSAHHDSASAKEIWEVSTQ